MFINTFIYMIIDSVGRLKQSFDNRIRKISNSTIGELIEHCLNNSNDPTVFEKIQTLELQLNTYNFQDAIVRQCGFCHNKLQSYDINKNKCNICGNIFSNANTVRVLILLKIIAISSQSNTKYEVIGDDHLSLQFIRYLTNNQVENQTQFANIINSKSEYNVKKWTTELYNQAQDHPWIVKCKVIIYNNILRKTVIKLSLTEDFDPIQNIHNEIMNDILHDDQLL